MKEGLGNIPSNDRLSNEEVRRKLGDDAAANNDEDAQLAELGERINEAQERQGATPGPIMGEQSGKEARGGMSIIKGLVRDLQGGQKEQGRVEPEPPHQPGEVQPEGRAQRIDKIGQQTDAVLAREEAQESADGPEHLRAIGDAMTRDVEQRQEGGFKTTEAPSEKPRTRETVPEAKPTSAVREVADGLRPAYQSENALAEHPELREVAERHNNPAAAAAEAFDLNTLREVDEAERTRLVDAVKASVAGKKQQQESSGDAREIGRREPTFGGPQSSELNADIAAQEAREPKGASAVGEAKDVAGKGAVADTAAYGDVRARGSMESNTGLERDAKGLRQPFASEEANETQEDTAEAPEMDITDDAIRAGDATEQQNVFASSEVVGLDRTGAFSGEDQSEEAIERESNTLDQLGERITELQTQVDDLRALLEQVLQSSDAAVEAPARSAETGHYESPEFSDSFYAMIDTMLGQAGADAHSGEVRRILDAYARAFDSADDATTEELADELFDLLQEYATEDENGNEVPLGAMIFRFAHKDLMQQSVEGLSQGETAAETPESQSDVDAQQAQAAAASVLSESQAQMESASESARHVTEAALAQAERRGEWKSLARTTAYLAAAAGAGVTLGPIAGALVLGTGFGTQLVNQILPSRR